MNIKEYISSGIIEHYVLGLASEEECKEVEMYSQAYPEIHEELASIEQAMEQYAQMQAIKAPAGLGAKISANIDALEKAASAPSSSSSILPKGALTILLGIVSLLLAWFAFSNYQQNQEQTQQIASLQDDLKTQQEDCDEINRQNDALKENLLILQDPKNQFIRLGGTDNAPNAIASVIYNSETQKSYLSIDELAEPPSDKQYQLWAIVDGTPVDMGVFDVDLNADTLQEIPHITNPAAFAVTLEKLGGNPTPTLDQMVLLGTV